MAMYAWQTVFQQLICALLLAIRAIFAAVFLGWINSVDPRQSVLKKARSLKMSA